MELRDVKARDEADIRSLLAAEGWTKDQIAGQVDGLKRLASSGSGFVSVAAEHGLLVGFITAEFHGWNHLAQIHGLAVQLDARHQGIASRLVMTAEEFARSRDARGIYVDTPVNNEGARAFYLTRRYEEAYRMPRYYSNDLDGITYIKFFD